MVSKITKHEYGVVQLPSGKTVRLSKTKPMYRAVKVVDGKEVAFIDFDKAKVEAWQNEQV